MTESTSSSSSSSFDNAPAPGSYRIDPAHSTVRLRSRHLFGLGGVEATFAVRSGEITVAEHVEASTATVVVDATTFHSDKPQRDKHVASASLLDSQQYPDIVFTSTSLRREGDGWVLSGALTAHGTTVPTDLVIDGSTHTGQGPRIHATIEHLDRYAFGVTKVKGMAGRHLDLEIDALLARA